MSASVADFLEGLGLAQYRSLFEEQAIDLDLLPGLSDAQLVQIGVHALGHRIKLMRAAAAWRPRAPSNIAAASRGSAAATAVTATTPLPMVAERRQLTVMFCDLVGSTALSQRLDPEDLRGLMQRYQQVCGEVVGRHMGTVAQYLGDGLMVYFGWPVAHEDDAQRAVSCGLQLLEVVKSIAAAEPPQVRVGIATGPVVVGLGDGSGDASQPRMAVGETPNLAARVQGQAEPDQLLVGASTWRLLGNLFEGQDLGERSLKGFSAPLRLWRVLREGRSVDRFAAARRAGLTPMVNRELELSLLTDRWSRACEGQGQSVLLAGEPGIGKSRLLAELVARVPPGSLLVRLQCSQLHSNSAFYPLMSQVVRAAKIERADGPELRLAKLEKLLAGLGSVAVRHARYFAALLSLPLGGYEPIQASPAKAKLDTIAAFVQVMLASARQRPVLMLAEDLHWMDPSSLDAMDALIAGLRDAPVLMVMTARSTLGARWAVQPPHTALGMVGLNRSHSLQLATSVAAAHGLNERIVARIVAHTDGVPLFLEELTRALAEGATLRKVAGAAGQAVTGHSADADLDAIAIPATLKDSLAARLDQLGNTRRVVQLGALLGRQFRQSVLLALHGGDEAGLVAQLDVAVAAGLLSRSGGEAEASYTFHHALIQDAAYESLLKSDRRLLHARTGEVLQAQSPELAETEPELLARHYGAGEAWDKAVPLWLKAGQRAWARGAAQEAIAHLESGIAVADKVSAPALRDLLELGLQSTLGVVYFAAVSYAAPQARAAFQRAEALCERIADPAMRVPVLYGVGAFQTMRGDVMAGHLAFERLWVQAQATDQARLQLFAQAVLAWSYCNVGEFERVLVAADEVRRLCAAGALVGPRLGAADPRVLSECFRAAALWALGRVEQARVASDGVLTLARTLDSYSLAYALNFAALLVPAYSGDDDVVLARTGEGIALATALGYPQMVSAGRMFRLWVQGRSGAEAAQAALPELDATLADVEAMGVGYMRAQFLSWRARLLLRVGDVGAAQLAVAQALGKVEQSGNPLMAVEVLLVEAEVLLAHGGEQRALACAALQTACDMARGQRALSWQLRATLALAQVTAEDDGPAAACELLAPLLAEFSEGHDSADLREAAMLLAQWRQIEVAVT